MASSSREWMCRPGPGVRGGMRASPMVTSPPVRSPPARTCQGSRRCSSAGTRKGWVMVICGPPIRRGIAWRAKLIAVQPSGMRLIIQARAPDVGGRGMLKQLFLDGVSVEPGDGTQPAGDGGPGPAAGFHVPGEALDVGAAGLEQADVVLLAPGRVLA